jgi:hypothetical protein
MPFASGWSRSTAIRAGLLADNMVPSNLRAAIVKFLTNVAQATALAETWTNDDYAEKLIPELYDALLTSYPLVVKGQDEVLSGGLESSL